MKLDEKQISILTRVREILERYPSNGYICLLVEEEAEIASHEERRLWINRILFWRQFSIKNRWIERREDLVRAIEFGLDGNQTVGNWFDREIQHVGLNLNGYAIRNRGLYRLIRLAWLDRSIETGELK